MRDHHERIDGSGYPEGLFGAQVQEFPRIAAVADVYDAVTSERVYKPAAPPHVGVQASSATAPATQFCPNVVRHFRAVVMPYPVGHEVTLADGRVGVVSGVSIDDPDSPTVRVMGSAGVEELVVDMTPRPPSAPRPPRSSRVVVARLVGRRRAGLDAAVVEADRQRRLLAGGGGARDRLAGLVLEQRVAAFQRALGVVGREGAPGCGPGRVGGAPARRRRCGRAWRRRCGRGGRRVRR